MENLGWLSPYKKLFKRPPSYSHLKEFDCLYFATKVGTNEDKFDSRSIKAIFLGYANNHKAYKLYNLADNTIFISRDVRFYKNVFPFQNIQDEHEVVSPLPALNIDYSSVSPSDSQPTHTQPHSILRKSTRIIKQPNRLIR